MNCNNAYATIGASNVGGSSGLPFFSQGAQSQAYSTVSGSNGYPKVIASASDFINFSNSFITRAADNGSVYVCPASSDIVKYSTSGVLINNLNGVSNCGSSNPPDWYITDSGT